MTRMTTQIKDDVVRYLEGDKDKEREARINAWLKEDRYNRVVFEEVVDIWVSLNDSENKKRFDIDQAWGKYSNWIDKQQEQSSGYRIKKVLTSVAKYAAVVALAIITTVFGVNYYSSISATEGIIADIPNGHQGTITLPDGTEVRLNGGSQLTCNFDNTSEERRVLLSGEAYFKVAHNKKKAFYVDVKNVSVKVYGTEFNVCGYPEDDFTETTLVNGKVGVQLGNGKEYQLNPQEGIWVSDKNEVAFTEGEKLENSLSWMNNACKFKRESLFRIAKRMERMYGYKVTLAEERLGNELYTGYFSRHEDIDMVMERLVLTSTFKMQYQIKDNEIIINRK